MAWQIWHKCNISDPEPIPYAVMRSNSGPPTTKIMCSRPNGCGEFFIVEGHELFKEAQPANGGIPGFVFPASRRQ